GPRLHLLGIWDTATAERRLEFGPGWGPAWVGAMPTSVSWSPEGKRLAIGTSQGEVKIADPATGKLMCTLSGHTSSIRSIVWSPDGKRLASAGDDGPVKVWDADHKQERLPLQGQNGNVFDLAWSPNGKRLASLSRLTPPATVKIYDAASGN